MTTLPSTLVVTPSSLPERLLAPIHLVSSRQRVLALLLASFQCLLTITISWLVLILLLGSFRNLPVGVALLLATLAWLSVFASPLFFRTAFRHHDPLHTARLIDHALPDSHERISSALELSQDHDARYQGSPELVAVLLRQAEHAAERLDPAAIISGKQVFRWFLALIPVLLLGFVLFVVLTPTMVLGAQRLLQPWQAATPLPTAKLDIDPQNITIAQGERVTITLAVTPVGPDALDLNKPASPATLSRRFSAGNANEDLASDMERTGNRSFRAILDNVQQSFTYRITSGGTTSPSYNVTVLPRPAADSVQVDYTFPPYTHRPPRSETTRQGAIDALIGTVVKLTVTPNQPLKSATLTITDNSPDPSILTLTPLANNHFLASFTVRKSTDYRLHFFNQQDLENADTQPRAIIARLDAPPQIAINTPTDAALKVRPDDTVPLKYTATDDFGLTRIELITQVDSRPPVVTALPLEGNPATTTGALNLALHTLINDPDIRRIAYSFRATDNRAPEPQVGLSSRQVLIIDRTVAPLAARQDAQAARTLADAVHFASANVDDAKTKLDALRQTAATRPLTDIEKQQAADARRDLSNAAQALLSAADKSTDSRLAEPARRAKALADDTLRHAQDNTAASQLAADQPDARNKSLDAASQNLADARSKLDSLARDIGDKARDQPLAHELERIAAEQRRLADALAQNPKDPRLLAQQRQLQQELEQIIKDHPDLQKPAALAANAQTSDLQKQLEDLRNAQQQLNDQARTQTDAAHIQDKLADLSKKQDDLNQKIQKFTEQQAGPLRQANAKTPDAAPLNSIGRELQDRKLSTAAQSQNAAATQLEETARQLENADKRQKDQETTPPGAPPAPTASDLQKQAGELQQHIADAQKNHDPPTRPSDPANQEATKLADQVRRQAQQAQQNPSSAPAEKQAAQQAASEADAAKREAAQGNAAAAQQHLAAAASALQQAAPRNLAPSPASPPPSSAQAAAQARELAQEQRDLADQSKKASESLDKAATAQNNAEQTARQQQQLADKMEQAAKSARDLQQKTQGSAPEVSQRAAQTAESLQKAADAQRQAAKAAQSSTPSQAAQKQQQSADALSSAQKSIGEQSSPSPGAPSSDSPGQSAASSGKPGEKTSSAQSSAAGQTTSPGQGRFAGQSSPSGQPGTSTSGSGSSAAQSVQAARDAQSQAAAGNPAAARQAADQLSQASQQLFSGDADSPGVPSTSSSPSAAGRSPQPDARRAGGNARPGGAGITLSPDSPQKSPSPAPFPKDLETLGISPSDWARLPAASQDQLLHAAQQSGPPAYRDMIKNYYSRIAHLDDQSQGPNP